jgi:hypothetical protein
LSYTLFAVESIQQFRFPHGVARLSEFDGSQLRILFVKGSLIPMKKSTLSSLVVLVFALGSGLALARPKALATSGPGQDSATSLSREFNVTPGQQITFDLPTGGGISITGSDSNVISITATLAGPDGAKCKVDMNQTASGIDVKSSYGGSGGGYSTNINLDVRVPRQFNVSINSAGGGIKIDNLEGAITGSCGGGSIRITNAKGNITLSTGGGAILVRDSQLDGTVSTGGGHVKIQGNKGNLTGSTGGGKVEYQDS